MATAIRRQEATTTIKDGKPVVTVELDCDSVADLPDATQTFANMWLHIGSIAWVIDAGEFYGLTSSGEWVKQGA